VRRGALITSLVVLGALAATGPSGAAMQGSVRYENVLAKNGVGLVSVTTWKAPSFRVLLRVPTQGRARLYLLGKGAPKGGPLIDTKTADCEGAAGSFYCRGSYEPLPKGTYTWRIVWNGPITAPVELTLRW
jgi:hypothetical protein